MRANELLRETYQKWSCPDAHSRRHFINSKMFQINSKGFDCKSCSGMCCTYENNSMQVDPLQALELVGYLESKNLISKYIDKISQSIKDYRLDKEVNLGKGRNLRRYYTCPFYQHQSCGCPIGTAHKPYGCLAFNPLEKNVSVEGKCQSDINVLEKRENTFSIIENEVNDYLREELHLYWEKLPMPVAVMEIIKKLSLNQKENIISP